MIVCLCHDINQRDLESALYLNKILPRKKLPNWAIEIIDKVGTDCGSCLDVVKELKEKE